MLLNENWISQACNLKKKIHEYAVEHTKARKASPKILTSVNSCVL